MCTCKRTTNLLVVGLVTCHSGGVTNSSSAGLHRMEETRQGQSALELVLQGNNRVNAMYTLDYKTLLLSAAPYRSPFIHLA